MTVLVLGLTLWWSAHLTKRLAPALRASLTERLGDRSNGVFALAILASVVLMVIGYRGAETSYLWTKTAALVGINNLLVLLGFYMFAASGAKLRVTRFIRHPQLVGFSLWALAHILVNGDIVSLMLFAGLLTWAVFEMVIITAQDGPYEPPAPAPVRKEVTGIIAALGLFAIVAGIHIWLGYNPFGG